MFLCYTQVLNVNDTSLEDKGAIQVALALAESPCPLEDLGMALDEITPQGMTGTWRHPPGHLHDTQIDAC
jgi:hypothetical protein